MTNPAAALLLSSVWPISPAVSVPCADRGSLVAKFLTARSYHLRVFYCIVFSVPYTFPDSPSSTSLLFP